MPECSIDGEMGWCWKVNTLVTFHRFKSYSKKVQKWIRITAVTQFYQLPLLAEKLNQGVPVEEAIQQVIKKQ
jgi:hypothetical protein